jgi:DNA-binding transcriptional LysR family regulator
MDLRRLRTFVAVAELGSVSKAALRVHITQPALSRQIRDLQQELGLRLFDRIGRGLTLTAEGEQLLGDFRGLLAHASSVGERAQLLRRGDAGVLRVSAASGQIEGILPTFLHRYAQRYPNVQVKLTESVGPDALVRLERGEVHLGMLLLRALPRGDHGFGTHPLPPVEILAACHPSIRMQRGSLIDVTRLASHPLLLLDVGFVVRRTFDAVCRLAGLKPNVLIESRQPSNLLALAEAGHGIAIIPSLLPTHRYALRTVRIAHEGKPLREPLGVVWDKRRELPRYAQDFAELIAAHARKLFPVTPPSAPVADDTSKRRRRGERERAGRS